MLLLYKNHHERVTQFEVACQKKNYASQYTVELAKIDEEEFHACPVFSLG